MAKGQFKSGNPWLTIWVKPSQTIADIVAFNPRHRLWVLAILHGLPMMLHVAQDYNLGSQYSTLGIVLVALLFSAIFGIIGITVGSAFCYWVGTWIGGKSPFAHVRTAVAWSNVPNIVTIAIWIFQIALFKESLFNGQFLQTSLPWQKTAIVGAGLVQLGIAIWSLYILICGLAEVQGFSKWRAFANVILAFLLFVAAIWLLIFAFVGIAKLIPA